jgi:hypothetical protein
MGKLGSIMRRSNGEEAVSFADQCPNGKWAACGAMAIPDGRPGTRVFRFDATRDFATAGEALKESERSLKDRGFLVVGPYRPKPRTM